MNNKKQIIYTYKSKRAAEKVRKIKNQRKGRKSFMVKIEMFNSTLPLCSGILLCTSGI